MRAEELRKHEKRRPSALFKSFSEYSARGKEAVASPKGVRYMGAPKKRAMRATCGLLVRRKRALPSFITVSSSRLWQLVSSLACSVTAATVAVAIPLAVLLL